MIEWDGIRLEVWTSVEPVVRSGHGAGVVAWIRVTNFGQETGTILARSQCANGPAETVVLATDATGGPLLVIGRLRPVPDTRNGLLSECGTRT